MLGQCGEGLELVILLGGSTQQTSSSFETDGEHDCKTPLLLELLVKRSRIYSSACFSELPAFKDLLGC